MSKATKLFLMGIMILAPAAYALYRMFRYYLLSCAAAFRTRDLQLYQFFFSPAVISGGYEPVR